jgi:peptidoglycan/xylan/chitin deacetylase (PgdA/CDA1 family)
MEADSVRSELLEWKRQLGRLWRKCLQWRGNYGQPRKLILLFHSIGNDEYSLPVDRFESYMSYLAEHATVASLETLLWGDRSNSRRLTCAITWDDGYASVHDSALAILKRHKFPATIYLSVGVINEGYAVNSVRDPGLYPGLRMLTWEQIADLQSFGFTLGSHLVHHLDLTRLSSARAIAELCTSRKMIEEHTNRDCLDFAYPWGRATQRNAQWVRQAGFRSAVTALHGPVPAKCDPMLIPRVDIRRDYNLDDFEAILDGDWDYLGRYQRLKQAVRSLSI